MANLPALTPTTFAEAMEFAKMMAQSTMVPKDFQRNPANILLAVQWGAELGMPPLQALQSIAVINGKPAVYGDAQLALVKASPHCEDVIEMIKGKLEDETASAVCEARRKGKEPVIRAFSIFDAKKAGLWGKGGIWQQYPLRMLQMRARGFALRDQFADVLRGMITVEEAADSSREMKDVTPANVAVEFDTFAGITQEPDGAEPEVDDVVSRARSEALKGYASFRAWYLNEIDDDQRTALKPHVAELQETATRSKPTRRRVPRKDEPTLEGLDQAAELEPPPEYNDSVLVLYNAEENNPEEWIGRARERLTMMDEAGAPADRYIAFRKANYAPLERLRKEMNPRYREIDAIIVAGEQRR